MCARQYTFHSRGSLLPTREDTDGVPWIPLWNPRLPISVFEFTKNEVVGGSRHRPEQIMTSPKRTSERVCEELAVASCVSVAVLPLAIVDAMVML